MADSSLVVIGAGWGRTGTMSLKLALEKLYGEKCHHMKEVIENNQGKLWVDVVNGKPDWGAIFRGYRTMVDFPGSVWYTDLMEVYPEAKVILTVRDSGEAWYRSASETIIYERIHGEDWAMSLILKLGKLGIGPNFGFVDAMWAKVGLSKDACRDEAKAVTAYEAWNAEVQRVVPRDKLLVLNVKEGWAPLCAFLGKPVPEGPFPRTNETEMFQKLRAKRQLVARALLAGLMTVSGFGLGLFVLLIRRLRRGAK